MLHFLIDASLPRATADVVRSGGHEATDVRDIGLGSASDEAICAYARSNVLCLLTRDMDFANVKDYPPEKYVGIVVIHAFDRAGRAAVLGMVKRFLRHHEIIDKLAGRLAIVEPSRIRLRPV